MTTRNIIGTFLVVVATACGGGATDKEITAEKPPAATQPADPAPATTPAEVNPDLPAPVAKAAKLASAIESNPEAADQILEDHEMNREDLDTLMYEIAADPELSAAYQAARTG